MLKKILIASAVATVSVGVSFAGNMGTPCPAYVYQTGPYIGASIGPQTNITSAPSSYKGFEGTLSGGWGHMVNNRFYIAAEVLGGSSISLNNGALFHVDAGSVSSSWSYGIDVLPGIMLTDTVLGYARIGAMRTNFNDINVQSTAWQVGLGGQTNLYKNIDIRGEYIYSQYQSIAGIGVPRVDQFNLGLTYKFV